MADKLISANELIKDLLKKSLYPVFVRRAIENVPAVDAVEVVRCKNCAFWEVSEYGGTIGRCQNPTNGLMYEYIDANDFCSYGKRKEK